ncbi:MAG: HAD family phosphatase [candidate division KSB1 bacterium]|nr:HAD family phosphatase [candidate division KSB1 bacterium]MDZ7368917.1 HAD family phosphatase [candidate division KSB1 bacterium]MDZ7406905.1 HAD family phosphatase [candidate division KSB1 bacterium]
MNIETVIFDIGGVLIDWNPRYLYKKLLQDENEIEFFLNNICTAEWNAQQDAGRLFRDGVAVLQQQYPQYARLIEAYDRRWEEMLGEADWETVKILDEIKRRGMPVYALTNWSAEKFPIAKKRYEFLNWFDGTLVSGEVGLKKPDLKIFRLMLEKYQIEAGKAIYLDDVLVNIVAASEVGLRTIHFQGAAQLREALHALNILS